MSEEIQKINEWLEERAIKSENDEYWINYKKENPSFNNSWPSYFRELKDINTKPSFIISSIHWRGDILTEYLDKHSDEYNIFPSTGSCTYIKK